MVLVVTTDEICLILVLVINILVAVLLFRWFRSRRVETRPADETFQMDPAIKFIDPKHFAMDPNVVHKKYTKQNPHKHGND